VPRRRPLACLRAARNQALRNQELPGGRPAHESAVQDVMMSAAAGFLAGAMNALAGAAVRDLWPAFALPPPLPVTAMRRAGCVSGQRSASGLPANASA